MTREERAERLRPRLRAAVLRTSLRDVAREVGISHTAVSDFLEGPSVPSDRTLYKVEQWAWRAGEDDLLPDDTGGAGAGGYAWAAPEPEAEELLRNLDHAVRLLDGIGRPGQQHERKLAFLEGVERTYAAMHKPLPDWWWSFSRRVKNGEL